METIVHASNQGVKINPRRIVAQKNIAIILERLLKSGIQTTEAVRKYFVEKLTLYLTSNNKFSTYGKVFCIIEISYYVLSILNYKEESIFNAIVYVH